MVTTLAGPGTAGRLSASQLQQRLTLVGGVVGRGGPAAGRGAPFGSMLTETAGCR
jgi:hypothetical protein